MFDTMRAAHFIELTQRFPVHERGLSDRFDF